MIFKVIFTVVPFIKKDYKNLKYDRELYEQFSKELKELK